MAAATTHTTTATAQTAATEVLRPSVTTSLLCRPALPLRLPRTESTKARRPALDKVLLEVAMGVTTEVVVAVATTRGLDIVSAEAMIRVAMVVAAAVTVEGVTVVAEAGMEGMAVAMEEAATQVVVTRVEGMVAVVEEGIRQ